jgi:tRNA (mo5U34)-methyltransferase
MGVLYHSRSPYAHLSQLRQCLRPGGQLILETLYVDEEAGNGLMPVDNYARMPKIWFIPSISTLLNWLDHSGYVDIEVIDESVTTIEEQRSTSWMPFESLREALDLYDENKTIEGLPAPKRVIVTAYRR